MQTAALQRKVSVTSQRSRPPRPDYAEYPAWMRDTLNIDIEAPQIKSTYEMMSLAALSTVEEHPFTINISTYLKSIADQYEKKTKTELLLGDPNFQLERKSFQSVVNKSYRYNISWNRRWPEAPEKGWCVPPVWFCDFDDIVRTTIICKYADGCQFIVKQLCEIATNIGLSAEFKSLENDEGYYAYHLYISFPADWLSDHAQGRGNSITTEIQVATQVQDLLRGLSHEIYEARRLRYSPDKKQWKWNFQSKEFMSGYIGHSLHFLEGLLIQLRDNKMFSGTGKAEGKGE